MTADRSLLPDAIHGYFGLTRDDYLVRNRTFLQAMPPEWQNRFVACLRELDDAFAHVEKPEGYIIQPAVQRELRDLSDEELAKVSYSKTEDDCDCYATTDPETGKTVFVPATCPHSTTYRDENGREVRGGELVMVPVDDDPVPHYRHAHIEPNLPAEQSGEAL